MSFPRMSFNPADGLNDKTHYPATPVSEEQARAQVQGISDQIRTFLNDLLLPGLENTQAGASGAEHIGSAPIGNVLGETVRAQLVDLKSQIDDIVDGFVSDGAIRTEKLADGAVTKAKMHPKAMGWTLVAQAGPLGDTGAFTIPSQAGRNEMMFQFRNADNTALSSTVIVPLDDNGVAVPAVFRVCTYCHADFSMDYRMMTMISPTNVMYGVARGESVCGTTDLKRIFIFVR